MADEKGIKQTGAAATPPVESVTEEIPHPADASSAPGPYVVDGEPMPLNRPPVSTNRPNVPIAHSLVAGAGAPTGAPEYQPEKAQGGEMVDSDEALTEDGQTAWVNEAPAASATRAEWDDYARSRGVDPDAYGSKDELQAALS